MIGTSAVTPDFHRALSIPLQRGRLFDRSDREDSTAVVIINESAAKNVLPGRRSAARSGIDRSPTIVGVVGDVRQTSLEVEPRPEAYMPMAQSRVAGGTLVIRTSGNTSDIVGAVGSAVFAVLPDVPLRNLITMEELIGRRVAQRRLNMLLLGLFGCLGLLISAVGVYGLP